MNRGAYGEQLAAEYLEKHGYQLVARNFRTRLGEIDIIAQDDTFLLFVEVKLRKDMRFGRACEAVTLSKQRKLTLTAEAWLYAHPTALQPRFDVIEIYLAAGASVPTEIQHLENAFDAYKERNRFELF